MAKKDVNGGKEDVLAMRMQTIPIQASQEIRLSVRTLARVIPMAAATATKTAVHVPWFETALNPIDRPSMPEPATVIQTGARQWMELIGEGRLTQSESVTKNFFASTPEDLVADIIETVDVAVVELEHANHIVRPCGDGANQEQRNYARNYTQDVEGSGYGEDAQTDLSFHH